MTFEWNRVVNAMNGPGTGVDCNLVRMNSVMGKLQKDLANLIRNDPRVACKELVNHSVADFTAPSDRFLAVSDTVSLLTGKVASALVKALMDLDIVPSEFLPLPAEASNARAIKIAVADLIGDVSVSLSSTSYAVNDSSLVGSHDGIPLVADQAPAIPGVPNTSDTAALASSDNVPSDAKSVSGTCPTLLTIRPSAGATS